MCAVVVSLKLVFALCVSQQRRRPRGAAAAAAERGAAAAPAERGSGVVLEVSTANGHENQLTVDNCRTRLQRWSSGVGVNGTGVGDSVSMPEQEISTLA